MKQPSHPPRCLRPTDHAQARLAPLLDRMRQHSDLLRKVRELLPSHLAERCRDCVLATGQRLIVYAESPAWCFQLRFLGPSVLEGLRSTGVGLFRNLEFRSITAAESRRRPATTPEVSEATAHWVMESGRSGEHVELGAALERLGRTLAARARQSKPQV